MMGAQPPYSPPPYPPKDAMRAQREAARAQRLYWRAQRRPSLIGPLLLIAIGVVALCIETGKLGAFAFWDWYIRWWPLLLIVIGVLSLGEWWLDRDNPYGRRHGFGGVIALLILLAIFGYSNHGLRRLGVFQDQNDGDSLVFHLFGEQHESDDTLNQAIPSGALVEIQVPRGDVTVTPSGDSQVHVQAHEVVYASNGNDARRSFDQLRPQLTVRGKTATLRTGTRNDGHADLIIEIPADALASIAAGHGDVTVEGLSTPLKLDAGKGDVKLDNLKANVDAHMGDGDFTAHAITGDVTVRGKLEDVALTDIQGNAQLDGDFFGDTHITQITGLVQLHSSRTSVEMVNLPGDLLLDSDDLQVNNASGPIKISTQAKDIACTGITGDVRIADDNGDVSLGINGQPGTIEVGNRNGAVQLTLPRDAKFTINATARNGDIQSDFDLPIDVFGDGHTLSGSIAGGAAKIVLTAEHGDIRISRNETSASSAASATPPAIPATPRGRSIRHLRPPPGGVPSMQTQ